ncbi:MAG TPA: winged helix-turn-helix domain-containing protein [Terriglobia bacterium]|nr:winged helix-turn-helix domain-containing protein [Terriglobia bacterium]
MTSLWQFPTHGNSRVGDRSYEVALRSGELRKHGIKVKIQEQPFQVLTMLLEHPGQIVTREELHKKLWPADTFVDFEHGLNAAINKLREAVGESADNPRFVETLPRRGYRFIAPVEGPVTPVGTLSVVAAVSDRRPPAGTPTPQTAMGTSPLQSAAEIPPPKTVGAGLVPAQGYPQGAPLRSWRLALALGIAGAALIVGAVVGYRYFRKPHALPMHVIPFATFRGAGPTRDFLLMAISLSFPGMEKRKTTGIFTSSRSARRNPSGSPAIRASTASSSQ